jgi:HEAT repeat protein
MDTITILSANTRKRIARHIENLDNLDSVVSVWAERLLIRFGPKAVEAVLAVADDPDPQVRFRCAWILGKSRDPRAFPALTRLTKDPDERVSYDATLALGELGDTQAIHVLAEIIANEPGGQLAGAATTALAKFGGAANVTVDRLKHSDDERVREHAYRVSEIHHGEIGQY